MRGVFLLFSLFSVAYGGGKLSEAENLERSQTCGRVVQKKVFGGKDASPKEAPWMAMVNYRVGKAPIFMGASMLSSRHVLTDATTLFTFDGSDKTYKWQLDGEKVDQNACQNGVMQIPSKYLTHISVNACGSHQKCYEDSSRIFAKRAVFLGSCFQNDVNYGMVLIEMDTDFAMDSGITPLCIGGTAAVGESVEMYGFGGKGAGSGTSASVAQLTKGTTKVTNCAGKFFSDISICVESINCDADMGSAYVKKIGDRMTALAVVYFSSCAKEKPTTQYISVDVFSSQICEFSGICAPNPSAGKPSERQTGKLTDEENRQRAVKCGSKVQSKIFGGRYISASEAPWTVKANYKDNGGTHWRSGSIVSRRHAIFSSTTLIGESGGSFSWVQDGKAVDVSSCQNGIMKVPDHVARELSAGTCALSRDPDDCHEAAKLNARSAVYVGSCESFKFGVIIVELEIDVNLDHVGYICVPDSPVTAIGDELKTYSVGSTTTSGQIVPRVNTGTAKVVNCNPGKYNDLSLCVSGAGGCPADGGAAYSKNVNGKETLVAVYTFGNCAPDDKNMWQVSVERLSSKICEVSGICKPKPLPTPSQSEKKKDNGGGSGQQGSDKKSGGGENGDKESDNSSSDQEDGAPGTQILQLFGLFALFFYSS